MIYIINGCRRHFYPRSALQPTPPISTKNSLALLQSLLQCSQSSPKQCKRSFVDFRTQQTLYSHHHWFGPCPFLIARESVSLSRYGSELLLVKLCYHIQGQLRVLFLRLSHFPCNTVILGMISPFFLPVPLLYLFYSFFFGVVTRNPCGGGIIRVDFYFDHPF